MPCPARAQRRTASPSSETRLPRTATVTAEADCRVLVLTRDDLTVLRDTQPDQALALLARIEATVRDYLDGAGAASS